MGIIDVGLAEESQTRYLTYALSVVSSRALPDVRDGLKPVQRRILYAMMHNLHLGPEKNHRKSAAVVGEVLARYHPHGDAACYEAMVRMAQDFSLRYPLVDGQGNFGSLDGDSAAAYRYTEAKLTAIASEVLGDIEQETVEVRDNFDQTTSEPVVLPSRIPNLLVNGSAGIAVGMATAIPPHNLIEVIKALLLLLDDESISDAKLLQAIKGPDFPTGCLVLNTKDELKEIYATGRGPIRMRANFELEEEVPEGRKKEKIKRIVITSIPYGVDKSTIVERIADVIIARKVPKLEDVRDESTDQVRVVLDVTPDADEAKILAYLFKHTPLQHSFHVNLTALVPTANPFSGRPELLSLRRMLQEFVTFRIIVVRKRLEFEKRKLDERVHVLEGLIKIIDVLDEVIEIVRKSDGRQDSANKLVAKFDLTEIQALFIVDLRIYQLSRTNVDEVEQELKEKRKRVAEIKRILGSERALRDEVGGELRRVSAEFGDARRSQILSEFDEPEVKEEEYVEHEDVFVIVSKDGWLKRIRANNDPATSRLREGDSLFFTEQSSTRNVLLLFSSLGNLFGLSVRDLVATSGFGEPVQKLFRFQDGESIVAAQVVAPVIEGNKKSNQELLLFTKRGMGFRLDATDFGITKKTGRRLVKLSEKDVLQGIVPVANDMLLLVSAQSYSVLMMKGEVPVLSPGAKGVILQKLPDDDHLLSVLSVKKNSKVSLRQEKGAPKEFSMQALTLGVRAKRGNKLMQRGGHVHSCKIES